MRFLIVPTALAVASALLVLPAVKAAAENLHKAVAVATCVQASPSASTVEVCP
jgi:hypothetical protein